jgi:alpha-beta hydrolase superfamily lysophospholipase
MDLRGHGRSSGSRGHFPSFDIVMRDINQLLDETQKMFPGQPVFLYGHSLGGALVLYYGYTQKRALHGIIATAPGLAAGTPIPTMKIMAGKVLNSVAPQMTLNNGLDFDSLSHDAEVKRVYLSDPLVHQLISARLAMQLLNAGEWIRSQHGYFPYPLLLMQGADDRIVDPALNQKFAEGLTGDVTFKMWPGMCHEIHNEFDKESVLKVMVDWLDQR